MWLDTWQLLFYGTILGCGVCSGLTPKFLSKTCVVQGVGVRYGIPTVAPGDPMHSVPTLLLPPSLSDLCNMRIEKGFVFF